MQDKTKQKTNWQNSPWTWQVHLYSLRKKKKHIFFCSTKMRKIILWAPESYPDRGHWFFNSCRNVLHLWPRGPAGVTCFIRGLSDWSFWLVELCLAWFGLGEQAVLLAPHQRNYIAEMAERWWSVRMDSTIWCGLGSLSKRWHYLSMLFYLKKCCTFTDSEQMECVH